MEAMKNTNIISANNSLNIDASQLFVNDSKGTLYMPQLKVISKKVRNLGNIEVHELDIKNEFMMSNSESGVIKANHANISTKYSYNSG